MLQTTPTILRLITVGVLLALPSLTFGSPETLIQSFDDPSPDDNNRFGQALAAYGDSIVVGSPNDDTTATNSGRAYLLHENGSVTFTFENPTPAIGDRFGTAVAVHDDLIIIGASSDDGAGNDGGAIHIFDGTTGNFDRSILNPAGTDNDEFGRAIVSLGGNAIAVGAPFVDLSNAQDGRVYVIDLATDTVTRTINNPTPDGSDHFGFSLAALNGDILVGSPFERIGVSTNFPGAAYRINPTTGAVVRKFNNPFADSDFDRFGWSVSAIGNNVLIGAPGDDEVGLDAGQAYVMNGTTGNLMHEISPPVTSSLSNFGNSVTAIGSIAIVGAPRIEDGLLVPGRAYAFLVSSGFHLAEFVSPENEDFGFFGSTLAPIGERLAIGATSQSVGAFLSGRVHLYEGFPTSPAEHWNLYE